ncbi:MAG: M56 family metallopeptidase, partial [Pirellulales bacterium]
MNDFFLSLSFGLLRATVALMLATVAIGLLLRLARPNSPVIHRAGWLMALAVGWMFVGWTVEVPWHAPPAEASSESQQASDLVAQPLALTDGDIDPTGDLFALPGPEQIADTVAAPAPALEHDAAIPNAGVTSTAATTITAEDAREAETNRAGAFLDWHVALALAWLIGLVSIVLVWMVNYLRFVRSLAPALTADQLAPAQWRIQWRQLLDEHAVRREIPLVATRDAGPSLCRLPRGYVLLVPQETWEAAPANERLAILRHELAHYQRGDVWKSLAARLLALPHWFNPASWWCVRRFDEAAEWACDRAAVDDLPAEQFAKVLLHLGSARWRHTFLNPAARGHGLATRVRRLLSGDARRDSTMKKLLVLAACAFVLLAGTLRVTLVAQEAPPRFTLTVTGEPTASKEPDTPDAESAPDGVANEPDNATRQLTQDLVDVSRQGYEVALSAYSAQTAPLETVCEWSRRWLAAELELDPAPRAQVEHCQQHLTRMESLYQRVEKLQARGARGGEAERLALINYYVVLAKRELGKAETRVAAAP